MNENISNITHGSLFSGIGGFDLAAQWVGWDNIFQCEKDQWCTKILEKNFPKTKRYADIKQFDAKKYRGTVDVISGGFPCQPFSNAGLKRGNNDDRYLWPEMLRIIDEIKPTWVIGENVPGIVNMELDKILFDLENQGYEAKTFNIPAIAVNAPHIRKRIFIVAYSNCNDVKFFQSEGVFSEKNKNESKAQERKWNRYGFSNLCVNISDTYNPGCKEQRQPIANEQKFFSPKCNSWWEVEPRMGRVVDGLPNRVDRLKGLGNAIVPKIAFEIFSAINSILQNEKQNEYCG